MGMVDFQNSKSMWKLRYYRLYKTINPKEGINGWQLAKMKKSIPDMSLSWNL